MSFLKKNLTGNAGLAHIGRFVKKLGLQRMLEQQITIKRGANARYTPADAVIKLSMGVLAGAQRVGHLEMLRVDKVIRTLLGWRRFPDNRTLGRVFRLFTHAHCSQLSAVEANARLKVWAPKWFGRITLDLD